MLSSKRSHDENEYSSIMKTVRIIRRERDKTKRHEMAISCLEQVHSTVKESGHSLLDLEDALLDHDCLDRESYETSAVARSLERNRRWLQEHLIGELKTAWGDSWWKDFEQEREPGKTKIWPLRRLRHLSKEEAKQLVAQAADERTAKGERKKDTGYWQQGDFELAAESACVTRSSDVVEKPSVSPVAASVYPVTEPSAVSLKTAAPNPTTKSGKRKRKSLPAAPPQPITSASTSLPQSVAASESLPPLWPNAPSVDCTYRRLPKARKYSDLAAESLRSWRVDLETAYHAHISAPSDATQIALASVISRTPCDATGLRLDDLLAGATEITLPFTIRELADATKRWRTQRPAGKSHDPEAWRTIIDTWDHETKALPLITGSVIMRTSDGSTVMMKLDAAIPEKLVAEMEDATTCMLNGWLDNKPVLPFPSEHDLRHDDPELQKKRHGTKDVGVFHLGCWIPDQGNPRGPVTSAECIGTIYQHRVFCEYEARLQGYYKLVNSIMSLAVPQIYATYRAHSEHTAKLHADYRMLSKASARLHLAIAVVRNLRVLPHTDEHDLPDGMVAMTNLGQSRGADLIVGTLGLQIKCQYKPGDLVLFNSHLVAHGITPFLADKKTGVYGKRTALVLFSHKSAVFHKPTIAAPARNLGSEFQRYGANVGSDLEGMAL